MNSCTSCVLFNRYSVYIYGWVYLHVRWSLSSGKSGCTWVWPNQRWRNRMRKISKQDVDVGVCLSLLVIIIIIVYSGGGKVVLQPEIFRWEATKRERERITRLWTHIFSFCLTWKKWHFPLHWIFNFKPQEVLVILVSTLSPVTTLGWRDFTAHTKRHIPNWINWVGKGMVM